jgi:hypothetical protein
MNAEQLEAFKRTLNPDPETHKINYPAAYRYIADIVIKTNHVNELIIA